MVKKKKAEKKVVKKSVKEKEGKKSFKGSEGGMSLSDAFGDDDDVEYAKSKPRKVSKKEVVSEKLAKSLEKAEEEMDEIAESGGVDLSEKEPVQIKASKPIAQIKKGDKIKVDSLILEVDAHYVLIDHGTTKEMTVECFDSKTDKDYQIRYFDDQVERTLDVYRLDEILYNRIDVKKVEW